MQLGFSLLSNSSLRSLVAIYRRGGSRARGFGRRRSRRRRWSGGGAQRGPHELIGGLDSHHGGSRPAGHTHRCRQQDCSTTTSRDDGGKADAARVSCRRGTAQEGAGGYKAVQGRRRGSSTYDSSDSELCSAIHGGGHGAGCEQQREGGS
jgi:hypothetical protein